jgi:serine/threonine protein kinase
MPDPSKVNSTLFPTISKDFEITRKIGAGGMGAVYEAIQLKLQRKVAVKVLADRLATDPEFLGRFLREARAAAVISHPNLVQVFDYGDIDGIHYSVMEYVEGENLVERLKRTGKLPVAEALEIVSKVAEALKAAFAKHIIHRDVKPENIMITHDGQVKLADLGLAKILSEDSSMTMTGMGLGSPHYMAPEQAEDAKDVDHRTDIYSLGVTLLTLVTGKKPFKGNSPYALIKAHAETQIPSGLELGTELPDGLDSLIQRMAAKRPDDRYAAYDDLLTDLMSLRTDSNATIVLPPEVRRSQIKVSPAANVSAAATDPTIASEISFAASAKSGSLPPPRNYALYGIVGITLAVVAFLLIDFARHSAPTPPPAPDQGVPNPPPTTPQMSQGSVSPGSLFSGAPSSSQPQTDTEVDSFLFGGNAPTGGNPGQSPPAMTGGPRPPPDFMMGVIRPNNTTAHFPLPLSHLGPPIDSSIQGSDLATLKANAAKYAADNPTNYRDILNAYEQVWHAARPPEEQLQIQAITLSHLKRMDEAADRAIAAYRLRMATEVKKGDTAAALRVWQDFPVALRSFRHEERIWNAFTNTLPAAEVAGIISRQPIRYGHPNPGGF